ncbi:hypothetical protein RG903_08715 [Thermithiobacillus tepidarius DSM 3134]|uniref:hypothetical protein n=1 Tax=Thermithiobacillus tepidarius TaxID=929 RepID=UPI00048B5ADA|nr:hypothetical protein [Thermithiobacillus tepidarius]
MDCQDVGNSPRNYSILLRCIAAYILIAQLASVLFLVAPAAASLGRLYLVSSALSLILYVIVAYGLWLHRKWGAWGYIAVTLALQLLVFYFLGYFAPANLLLPMVMVLLILSKYKWLK